MWIIVATCAPWRIALLYFFQHQAPRFKFGVYLFLHQSSFTTAQSIVLYQPPSWFVTADGVLLSCTFIAFICYSTGKFFLKKIYMVQYLYKYASSNQQ
jgi:hypothetical protein